MWVGGALTSRLAAGSRRIRLLSPVKTVGPPRPVVGLSVAVRVAPTNGGVLPPPSRPFPPFTSPPLAPPPPRSEARASVGWFLFFFFLSPQVRSSLGWLYDAVLFSFLSGLWGRGAARASRAHPVLARLVFFVWLCTTRQQRRRRAPRRRGASSGARPAARPLLSRTARGCSRTGRICAARADAVLSTAPAAGS